METFFADFRSAAFSLALRLGAAILVFLLFWLASVVLHTVVRRLSQRSDASKRDIVDFLARVAKVTLLLFGVVTALGTAGINVSALVTGLGLTGFALGFALKDVLANLLAGVLILIYRPFRRNDRIAVAGFEGTVTDIDLRYTHLQAAGRHVLIPNSTLFTTTIVLLEEQR
ncbi:MAG: mechanosensitive ion channel family protein [Candidatus Binatia bacterium]|nr:mechanosensitive ion channel family protein [Candidatus Binatia bacterium]